MVNALTNWKMTRIILFSCLLILTSFIEDNRSEDPFKSFKYDKVVAYDYNGIGGIRIVDSNGHITGTVRAQTELTKKQFKEINKTLSERSTYGGTTASCFDPHLGIVYYFDNKMVAHISICLECNYLESSFAIPATENKQIITLILQKVLVK